MRYWLRRRDLICDAPIYYELEGKSFSFTMGELKGMCERGLWDRLWELGDGECVEIVLKMEVGRF